MEIIIKDGIKYSQPNFHNNESDFEKIVFSQHKHIFGENTLLFTKQKIKTETGIGTIPDGFILDFEKDKWYIIEVEISNHDVYNHIVPQLTKFKSALSNQQTRKNLIKFFDSEIKADPYKNALLISHGKNEVFKIVSEIIDNEPELIIIIEQAYAELTNIFESLPFKTKINVFKVFTRDGSTSGDSIFQFAPIANHNGQKTIQNNYQPRMSEKHNSKVSNETLNIDERNIKQIERVRKLVPKWFSSNQKSSKILINYMKLLEEKGSVKYENLERYCSNIGFKGDGNLKKSLAQMNNFGEKNYAKVFETDIKDEIILWQPVEDFIINEYEKFKMKN